MKLKLKDPPPLTLILTLGKEKHKYISNRPSQTSKAFKLGDRLGPLRDSMLGKLSRQHETLRLGSLGR